MSRFLIFGLVFAKNPPIFTSFWRVILYCVQKQCKIDSYHTYFYGFWAMSQHITPWVIGNWKMNPVHQEAQTLLQRLKQRLHQHESASCRVAVAPTTLHLLWAKNELSSSPIQVVAQDVSRIAELGAYTGEVSATLLKDSQIDYVLIGHSERRTLFADDVAVLQDKIRHALKAGLSIVYCVGESLQQREQGDAETTVLQQICDLERAVERAEDWQNVIIAYEPIWAIGTGQTASAEDAQSMHQAIRQGLAQMTEYANKIPLLYGGSVKAENAPEFAQCADVNGVLVGGASLKADDFYQIIQAFVDAKHNP